MSSHVDSFLDEYERINDRVKPTRELLDRTLSGVLEENRRQAVLDLLYECYRSCDQRGLDTLIVLAQFYGFDLSESDLCEQLARCSQQVVTWWLEPCPCD